MNCYGKSLEKGKYVFSYLCYREAKDKATHANRYFFKKKWPQLHNLLKFKIL